MDCNRFPWPQQKSPTEDFCSDQGYADNHARRYRPQPLPGPAPVAARALAGRLWPFLALDRTAEDFLPGFPEATAFLFGQTCGI